MAYTLEEMKKLRGGPGNFRKLDLKNGDKKIWIPKMVVTYHRVHNKIKQITSFKSAKGDFKDCLNQEYGARGKGCPICEQETKELWEKWRALKEAGAPENELKAITKMINDLTQEEYYINAIDIKDPDRKYYGARLTPAIFKALEQIDVKYGVENVIITYSRTENPTRYAMTADDDRKELIKELKESLEMFDGREEADGGIIDLDTHLIRKVTLQEYNSWLTSGEVSEEDHPTPPPDLEKKTSKTQFTKPNETKKEEKTTKPVEDDVIPLDDLEAPDDKKKEEKKETKSDEKKTTPKSDFDAVPDLDNLDLDNLEAAEKMVKLEAKTINERRTDKTFVTKLYDYLLKEKKISSASEYKEQLLACYNYTKAQNGIEVPEGVVK